MSTKRELEIIHHGCLVFMPDGVVHDNMYVVSYAEYTYNSVKLFYIHIKNLSVEYYHMVTHWEN